MVNPDEIVSRQLTITEPTRVDFVNGQSTTLIPSRTVPQVIGDGRKVSLDGTWNVTFWPFQAEEASLVTAACDDNWYEVNQPGKVFYADPNVCPSDIPNWDRQRMTHVDLDDGAILRRDVEIPSAWAGKRIFLRFDAVYPACRVYLDGKLLGEHLSGLTPVEFDVTSLATPGSKAGVAVRLLRNHELISLDMPRHALDFAGMPQSAYFHATEACHVGAFHLMPRLSKDYSAGLLTGQVVVNNLRPEAADCRLKVAVFNPRDKSEKTFSTQVHAEPGASATADVKLDMGVVDLWNDEFPNLYEVTIRLECAGQDEQEIRYRTGFRTLELSLSRPRLNGRPVKFRGVNHLTFHRVGGMHTPADFLRRSLTLMKRANINCIRTHFLAPPALADLCDEMGFYLIQELPVDWAAHLIEHERYLGPILMRIEGGVRRDRHHCSIVGWSVGNENLSPSMEHHDAFWAHMHAFDRLAKKLSPDRFTMFPPPGPANKIKGLLETRVGDVADTHYSFKFVQELNETGKLTEPKSWQGPFETLTRQQLLDRGWCGVWFSSEYGLMNYPPDVLNGPYLSIIGDVLENPLSGKNSQQVFIDRVGREWGIMRDDPACLGGAFFPWMCSGSGDAWGWMLWGEDADWGVVTHDLLPKPSFWALRVIYSPVILPQRTTWKPGQTELVLPVRNLYNAIDLSACTFRTMLGGGMPFIGQLRAWKDIPVSCAPGESVEVRVPIWNEKTLEALNSGSPAVCRCVILDPKGYRPITADVLIAPESLQDGRDAEVPIGPDANLAAL